MPLRSVKMNRFIFGFQRRVWCPKWTPLSSSWRMVTTAMVGCSLFSLVVTPTGGGRPGARSPAVVGPDERSRPGRAVAAGYVNVSGRGHARSTACRGRRAPSIRQVLAVVLCGVSGGFLRNWFLTQPAFPHATVNFLRNRQAGGQQQDQTGR